MGRKLLFSSIAGALLGAATFHLGVFDRPEFVYHKSVLEAKPDQVLYAILATTTEKSIGAHVGRLLHGTKDALDATSSQEAMKSAAALYGAPEGADVLSVGLYFDDPHVTEHPRWAIGWAVDLPSYEDVEALQLVVQEKYPDDEPIRAVRIGPAPILKATIPWRSMFTPMIAPMFHWGRAFEAYSQGGYDVGAIHSDDGPVSCEVYVTGANDSMEYIDYVVLMGDTTRVLNDCFPSESEEEIATEPDKEEEVSEEEKAAEESSAEPEEEVKENMSTEPADPNSHEDDGDVDDQQSGESVSQEEVGEDVADSSGDSEDNVADDPGDEEAAGGGIEEEKDIPATEEE